MIRKWKVILIITFFFLLMVISLFDYKQSIQIQVRDAFEGNAFKPVYKTVKF
jgi:hypothetical protein